MKLQRNPSPAQASGLIATGITAHVENLRTLLTQLNLHYAGVGILALLNLYLLVQIGFSWREASSHNEEALAQQGIALKTAEIAAKPLQGLDGKLVTAHAEADAFYRRRLPGSYSEVLAELGVLTTKNAVKLNAVQYAQAPVLGDQDGALTEVTMDASLSGDYRSLVECINGLERDKQFFLINGLTLTGAQSGSVNLRLRLLTYLREPTTAEEPRKAGLATPIGSETGGGR